MLLIMILTIFISEEILDALLTELVLLCQPWILLLYMVELQQISLMSEVVLMVIK